MDKEQVSGLFMRGQDCGQVVFGNYADELGIPKDEANRLAAAFGGGTGIGETCGAVIRERRGSCMCSDLLGDDISTPEGLGRILEAGTMFSLCPELVLDAIDILDEMNKK